MKKAGRGRPALCFASLTSNQPELEELPSAVVTVIRGVALQPHRNRMIRMELARETQCLGNLRMPLRTARTSHPGRDIDPDAPLYRLATRKEEIVRAAGGRHHVGRGVVIEDVGHDGVLCQRAANEHHCR